MCFFKDLELCIGCMQTVANIKLYKQCPNTQQRGEEEVEQCQSCGCRLKSFSTHFYNF